MKLIRGISAPTGVHVPLALLLGAVGWAFSPFQALAATGLVNTSLGPLAASTPATAPPIDGQPAGATLGNPLWGIPLHVMSATRERPLFSPSRRPPSPPIAAAPPPPPPPSKPAPPPLPSLALLGTVVGSSESIGVFLDEKTKDVVRLRIGEGHDGWTLSAIQLRKAVLKQGRREASLGLSPGDSKVQEVASAAPSNPVSTPPKEQTPIAQSSGKWLDGDGRPIEPPPGGRIARGAPPGRWVDGDGRLISPPAQKASIKNRAPATNSWLDGDGQAIAPPPTRVGVRAER